MIRSSASLFEAFCYRSKSNLVALSHQPSGEPGIDTTRRVPGRAYQKVRDPERLLMEERAEALSAAGYPLPDHDPAMYAEQRLKEAREAARSSQVGSVRAGTAGELSAREVCQVLREVTFERRTMTKMSQASWDEVYEGHFVVSIEGWRISIYNDCGTLDYCEECISPDGRRRSFDSGARFGTDPIALLSTWEHHTLEKLLKALLRSNFVGHDGFRRLVSSNACVQRIKLLVIIPIVVILVGLWLTILALQVFRYESDTTNLMPHQRVRHVLNRRRLR